MLGNAPTLTPVQVATQLVANATRATITNLPSGTTNALLYQQPASSTSFSLSAELDGTPVVSDITADDSSVVAYEEDPGIPQPPVVPVSVPVKTNDPIAPSPVAEAPAPPVVEAPAKPAPPAPIPPVAETPAKPVEAVVTPPSASSEVSSVSSAPLAAPLRTSAMTNISIGKITKVGKQLRVAVNAPKGSKVSLYRNGKLVGKGMKKFFMVPVSKVKKQNFTAVISVAGAFVSSASVSLPVRSASLR
jgi:flagellar motor switch/type III secretory pathway protein FliN